MAHWRCIKDGKLLMHSNNSTSTAFNVFVFKRIALTCPVRTYCDLNRFLLRIIAYQINNLYTQIIMSISNFATIIKNQKFFINCYSWSFLKYINYKKNNRKLNKYVNFKMDQKVYSGSINRSNNDHTDISHGSRLRYEEIGELKDLEIAYIFC